jgi:YD repeat-containing protein
VHGNPVTITDADGSVVTGTYDLLNRVVQRNISPGPGVAGDTTLEKYKYDGLSRLVFAQDDDSTIARRYDSLGNVIEEILLHGHPFCGNGIIEPGELCDGGPMCGPDCIPIEDNCCVCHEWAGCTVPGIEECVCDEDPYCCDICWDALCVIEVNTENCGFCPEELSPFDEPRLCAVGAA